MACQYKDSPLAEATASHQNAISVECGWYYNRRCEGKGGAERCSIGASVGVHRETIKRLRQRTKTNRDAVEKGESMI